MKKVLALIAMLVVYMAFPIALGHAQDETNEMNVDINIDADLVNLNITSYVSQNGTLHIFVNGTEITKTTIIKKYGASYRGEIIYLSQRIGETTMNLMAFANYTSGRLSVLLANDKALAKWVGCLNSTDPIGKRIFEGNSSVVLELRRLDEADVDLDAKLAELSSAVSEEFEDVWGKLSDLELETENLSSGMRTFTFKADSELDSIREELSKTQALAYASLAFAAVLSAFAVATAYIIIRMLKIRKP